jgi:hypothetical protein
MKKLGLVAVCNVVIACGDPPVASQPTERRTPTIDSVATSDGFTQICQGCAADLVITGDRLANTRSVVCHTTFFGDIAATILHASNHELRAHITIPHGESTDRLDLTISGPQGDATSPGAIQVTPVVISASASPEGDGTFQSPRLLCDPRIEQAGSFDLLFLLAGTHTCDRVLHLAPDIAVVGEGTGITRVIGTGTGIRFDFTGPDPSGSPVVADLTIDGATDGPSIVVHGGNLLISHVEDRGGIQVTDGSQVQIDSYAFDGPGRAIAFDSNATCNISNVTIRNCSEGIAFDVTRDVVAARGVVLISGLTIEHCGLGIRIGTLVQAPDADHLLETSMQGVQLVGNTRGVLIQDGNSFLTDSAIRGEPTPATPTSGIRVENGSLSLSFSELTGNSAIGLDVDTAATGSSGSVGMNTVSITGGEIGVRIRGFDRGTVVNLLVTTVRDQTVATVQLNGAELFEPSGQVGSSTHNTLSVTSGFALDDERTTITPLGELFIASGFTLNGNSYTGQLLRGPLSIGSDIHITSAQASWLF